MALFAFTTERGDNISLEKRKVNEAMTLADSYKLVKVTYYILDDILRDAFEKAKSQSFLKEGSDLNNQVFIKERDRLAKVGFEVDKEFKKEDLKFQVDTNKNNFTYTLNIMVVK